MSYAKYAYTFCIMIIVDSSRFSNWKFLINVVVFSIDSKCINNLQKKLYVTYGSNNNFILLFVGCSIYGNV